jgi:hypothetical protein
MHEKEVALHVFRPSRSVGMQTGGNEGKLLADILIYAAKFLYIFLTGEEKKGILK